MYAGCTGVHPISHPPTLPRTGTSAMRSVSAKIVKSSDTCNHPGIFNMNNYEGGWKSEGRVMKSEGMEVAIMGGCPEDIS